MQSLEIHFWSVTRIYLNKSQFKIKMTFNDFDFVNLRNC